MRIEFRTFATTWGTGPFHPAIEDLGRVMYWPNITFPSEDAAYSFAAEAVKRAHDAAEAVAQEWNIYDAT